MPFVDPADKKRWNTQWKKIGKEIGYNKWLYERRKLKLDDAVEFRSALEAICEIGETRDVEVAMAALKASDMRYKKLGPSPRANGVPVPKEETRKGDTLAEALAKLGLN